MKLLYELFEVSRQAVMKFGYMITGHNRLLYAWSVGYNLHSSRIDICILFTIVSGGCLAVIKTTKLKLHEYINSRVASNISEDMRLLIYGETNTATCPIYSAH